VLNTKTLRNALIHTSYFLSRSTRSHGGRVLCFHDIGRTDLFRNKMQWLKKNYTILSVEDLITRGGDGNCVAVTFDDGYAGWHEHAVAVLEALGIPAVFFICSGLVGLEGTQAQHFMRDNMRRTRKLHFITKPQLRTLAEHPLFQIGSHTVSHIDLGHEWDEQTLQREIAGDRRTLEQWSGCRVKWFAYPFGTPGTISHKAMRFIREQGFNAAFSLIPSWWDSGRNPLMVGRDGLDIQDDTSLWRAWLNGRYDSLYAVKSFLTSPFKKSARTPTKQPC